MQLILEFKAAQPRHAQITDDAALEPRIGMLEKFHGIFEYDVREVDRLSQIYEQKRDNRIIIDQIDFGDRFFS